MNRKNMPLLLMLIAGACTWIVTLVRSYSLLASLVALFTVMLHSYNIVNVSDIDTVLLISEADHNILEKILLNFTLVSGL
jgi:hypothetical protein